jgi:hypothetical protein
LACMLAAYTARYCFFSCGQGRGLERTGLVVGYMEGDEAVGQRSRDENKGDQRRPWPPPMLKDYSKNALKFIFWPKTFNLAPIPSSVFFHKSETYH